MRIFGELATAEQVSEINNLILKNFSLRRVIESVTILDTAKVINQVEQFLLRYEHLAGRDVPNDREGRAVCAYQLSDRAINSSRFPSPIHWRAVSGSRAGYATRGL